MDWCWINEKKQTDFKELSQICIFSYVSFSRRTPGIALIEQPLNGLVGVCRPYEWTHKPIKIVHTTPWCDAMVWKHTQYKFNYVFTNLQLVTNVCSIVRGSFYTPMHGRLVHAHSHYLLYLDDGVSLWLLLEGTIPQELSNIFLEYSNKPWNKLYRLWGSCSVLTFCRNRDTSIIFSYLQIYFITFLYNFTTKILIMFFRFYFQGLILNDVEHLPL